MSMSAVLSEVLDANAQYAAGFGDRGSLPLPPARRFAILTCMDARLDPAKYAGLAEGDAQVIRNAVGPGSVHGHFVKWLTFGDLENSVVEDVQRIRSHPLVNPVIPIFGYIYDVRSGRLIEVPDATCVGAAKV
jgi:carbonic anhydrase